MQVEPEHGVAYGKPITRVRESVAITRALLREGKVSYEGETVRIENFDLWFKPRRPGLAFYAGFFPRYNRLIAAHGFAVEAAAIAEAWARGDQPAAVAAVSDTMIDATSIAGTPAECRARLDAYRQSGIDLPIISPFARGPGAKAVFERAIAACAPG